MYKRDHFNTVSKIDEKGGVVFADGRLFAMEFYDHTYIVVGRVHSAQIASLSNWRSPKVTHHRCKLQTAHKVGIVQGKKNYSFNTL